MARSGSLNRAVIWCQTMPRRIVASGWGAAVALFRCVSGASIPGSTRHQETGACRQALAFRPGSKPSHFGEFAEVERNRFDDLAVVLFEADFAVRYMWCRGSSRS